MKTLLILIALVLVGCEYNAREDYAKGRPYWLNVDTVRGHEYITTDRNSGVSTIHAEHCNRKGAP
jgi:hypothetical protein